MDENAVGVYGVKGEKKCAAIIGPLVVKCVPSKRLTPASLRVFANDLKGELLDNEREKGQNRNRKSLEKEQEMCVLWSPTQKTSMSVQYSA